MQWRNTKLVTTRGSVASSWGPVRLQVSRSTGLASYPTVPSLPFAQIVQYIRMVRDDYPESPYGEYGSLTTGEVFPWYEEYGFGMDMEAGHGTHTAGSVAGEPLSTPAELVECPAGGEVGCIGECTSTDTADDNLLTWNRLCPQFDCDGFPEGDGCLSENIAETLTDNGGVARGAKISVFDASIDGTVIWASLVGNGLWNATLGTGCMLHSNSWGADGLCTIDSETVEFDKFMYDVSLSGGRVTSRVCYGPRACGVVRYSSWFCSSCSLEEETSSLGREKHQPL